MKHPEQRVYSYFCFLGCVGKKVFHSPLKIGTSGKAATRKSLKTKVFDIMGEITKTNSINTPTN
jgi:hypothetical protein